MRRITLSSEQRCAYWQNWLVTARTLIKFRTESTATRTAASLEMATPAEYVISSPVCCCWEGAGFLVQYVVLETPAAATRLSAPWSVLVSAGRRQASWTAGDGGGCQPLCWA